MENKTLSITELKALLETEEYKYQPVEREYIKTFEDLNVWTSEEGFRLFDTLTEQNGGKPPKQDDYLNASMEIAKAFWFKESPMGRLSIWKMKNGQWSATYLTWGPQIEKAVRWRLSRMYQSYIVEYSAACILHSLYPSYTLLASYELDLVAGVDLTVVSREDNKIIYLHVTKNSPWALKAIDKKGKKKAYYKDKKGNKHYWQRDYSNSHAVLAYDKHTSDTTEAINGHYIFKEAYIVDQVNKKMAENNIDVVSGATSELFEFHKYLKNSKIAPDGISSMVISFKNTDKGEKK